MNVLEFLRSALRVALVLFSWRSRFRAGSRLLSDIFGSVANPSKLDTRPESRKLMYKIMVWEYSVTFAVGLNTVRTRASSILLLKWSGKAVCLRGRR